LSKNADTPSAITQTPWDVAPGTYVCANGQIVYLEGTHRFLSENAGHQKLPATTSIVCHTGETASDGSPEIDKEGGAVGGEMFTKENTS
jgi:hypothetical protein